MHSVSRDTRKESKEALSFSFSCGDYKVSKCRLFLETFCTLLFGFGILLLYRVLQLIHNVSHDMRKDSKEA